MIWCSMGSKLQRDSGTMPKPRSPSVSCDSEGINSNSNCCRVDSCAEPCSSSCSVSPSQRSPKMESDIQPASLTKRSISEPDDSVFMLEATSRERSNTNDLVTRFSHGLDQIAQADSFMPSSFSPSKKFPVVFKWTGGGNSVFVSGSYDNWTTKVPLARSDSHHFGIVEIPVGRHEYKYFVDGCWMCDPNEIQTGEPTQNNVITTKRSDFNVLEALSADDYVSETDVYAKEWTQHIPARNPGIGYMRVQAPTLPPYINDGLLNKEMSSNNDASLLLEPNRVILNHLYTLSIKDGVIVLSSTCRYRRKYITTVLYKPF